MGYERLDKPIKETQRGLLSKLNSIRVGGGTALGPGVVTAVSMAAQG